MINHVDFNAVNKSRVIVHMDLDAFFASVETIENPALKHKPVVVGGQPDKRGVVAAASYQARKFGIRSAMPMYRAIKLCPEAVIVPPNHSRYRSYSKQVMAILRRLTHVVEPISIDEAFLDLTDQVDNWNDATTQSKSIQNMVKNETGLSASIGVATNKLIAKVASDRHKPGGFTVVPPGKEAEFLTQLPVKALWGIGPVTSDKLAYIGVQTIGDLSMMSEKVLKAHFGSHGREMLIRSKGIDDRPVMVERETKSVSHERTFTNDLIDLQSIKRSLWEMSKGVGRQLLKEDVLAKTIAIKLRYPDFTTLTRQMSLNTATDNERVIYRAALLLFQKEWTGNNPIRLLGVAGTKLSPRGQLPLFGQEKEN